MMDFSKKCLSGVVALLLVCSWETAALGQIDPRKPAAIDTQDVPVVPADLVAKLAQYQNVRGAAFRGWAPDGTGILINTRFGNSSQLHRVYEPGGRREQVTFFDEPVSGRFIPHSSAESILLLKDTGGNENDQIYLLDRKTITTRLLTDGKSRNKLGPIRRDGGQFVVVSNQRNGRDGDLYRVKLDAPQSLIPLMQVENQTWITHDWSPDGGKLLISRFVSANESYAAVLDVESGERDDLKRPADGKSAIGSMAFSADGQSILLTTDADSEFRRLARYQLATKSYEWLTSDIDWDVTDLSVDPNSGNVALTVNADGATRLFVIASQDGIRREIPLPLGVVSGIEFSANGDQIGMTLSRPDAPPDAYSVELQTGELTRWTYSEVGGLNPETFVTPERIRFRSFDGRMIPAYYFRPRPRVSAETVNSPDGNLTPKPKVPVYISIHGGPESQYQPFFSPIIQYYLNELGIAVICPNVRGSSGYGKTYLLLDNAEKREDSVKDIGALLDWIESQEELDSSRVAVAGASYGGYMTLASLTHYGDRIKAGIDVVGIANFVTFLERTAGYRVDLRRAEYGDERLPEMKEVFDRISPLNRSDQIRAALMVVHGRNDPRVPFFEAEQIAARVRSTGQPVWTVFANNEGHGFTKKDNVDFLRAVEVLFLKTNLIHRSAVIEGNADETSAK